MIYETIITTINNDDSIHIAPMGLRIENKLYLIQPFKPSTTLENLERTGQAVINLTNDVLIFAGCLTGRYNWPTKTASKIDGGLLEAALTHIEVEVEHKEEEELRPRFYCKEIYKEVHSPFPGFNRAQAAVLEAAILVSRLDMLPMQKIEQELEYLNIAIEKTAGEKEQKAWGWLMSRIEEHKKENEVKI